MSLKKSLQASVIQSPAPPLLLSAYERTKSINHLKSGACLKRFIHCRASSTRISRNAEGWSHGLCRRFLPSKDASGSSAAWKIWLPSLLYSVVKELRAFRSLQRQSSKDCLKRQANSEAFLEWWGVFDLNEGTSVKRNGFTAHRNCHYPNSPS